MSKTQPRASVYFPPDLNDKLDKECDKTGLSKSKLVVKLLEEYFNKREIDSLILDLESDPRFVEINKKYLEMKEELEKEFIKYAEEMKEIKGI